MKLRTYILISFLCLSFIQAQCMSDVKSDTAKAGAMPAWIFKFSPLALVEIPQPSVQFAIEYKLTNTFSLQHELGWFPAISSMGIFEQGEKYNGGKIKTELRFYFEDEPGSDEVYQRSYLAFEGLYRIRVVRKEAWYWMNDGSFSQWLELYQNRQQYAFHFKYGRQKIISQKHGVFIDYYAGFGLRKYFSTHTYITKDLQGVPDNTEEIYDFMAPSLSLGIKVGIGR